MSDRTTTQGVSELSCTLIEAQSFAERYLLGELTEPDRNAYEQHYFDCERCFDGLTTVGALKTELNATLPSIAVPPAGAHPWRPVWLSTAAVVVLGVGLWSTRATPETDATPPITSAPPAAAVHPPDTSPAVRPPVRGDASPPTLIELARFAPPTYHPVVLRGPEDDARRAFTAALEHYVHGEYRLAIDGLRTSVSMDPTAPGAGFFLGVCLLLTGDAQAGITELRRTIALGDSAYVEDAHFYLAKGLLETGDAAAARRELRAMIALDGDHQSEGRRLLSQIDRVRSGR